MSLFGAIANAFKTGAREINKEYGKNDDFLLAVCASSALVANADGIIEDSERTKTISLIRNHSTLSKLYNGDKIEATVDRCLKLSKDKSGKQELARYLDHVRNTDNAKAICEDVYLVAADIAAADGSVGPEEEQVLKKIADRLSVDTTKFDF